MTKETVEKHCKKDKKERQAATKRLTTAKCYKNINSEYTIEYTKHITNTYQNKNHQMISSELQISSIYKTTDELRC